MTAALQNVQNDTSAKQEKWFKGVDTLRFVLAFIVVMGHFSNPAIIALKDSPHTFPRLFAYFFSIAFDGPAAVIAFFMISGFVIHYPYRGREINLEKFYIRRYVRILVPLIAISVIGIFFDNAERGVTWSLYCELIYYTIYPFIIRIKTSINVKILVSVGMYLLVLVFKTGNNFFSLIHQRDEGYDGNYMFLGHYYNWIIGLPCWLAGVKLADEIDNSVQQPKFTRLLILRILSWSAATFCLVTRFHYFFCYIYNLNLLCFIFFFWIRDEINYYRYAKPITFLESWGKFSYSLYLTHLVTLHMLARFITVDLYNYVPIIALIMLIAYLFYQSVEKTSHIWAKQLAARAK